MEKLNCKSLMIGDWVYRPDCYDKVKEIRENGIIGRDYLRGIISFKELEPIPLTPEILEKNGIVYDYDETECVADYKYVNIKGYQFYDDDNSVLIDYCNGHIKLVNDITNTVVDMDINYVHELQHALRLCQINKEIVL